MQNLRLAEKILPSLYLHGGREPHEEELTRYFTEYLISGMSLKLTPIWSSDMGVKIYEDMRG